MVTIEITCITKQSTYTNPDVICYYEHAYQTENINNDVIGYYERACQTEYTNSDVIGYLLLVGPEV